MKYLKIVIFLFTVSLGAQNYQYSIDQGSTILQEEEGDPPENTNAIPIPIPIPQDFDWSNIPADYDNAVWIIKYDFDLKNRRVSLPENVTLSFEGGILRNATLNGDKTLVASDGNYQVFETIDFDGTFKNEYLKPCWFGAVMDGVTDDRIYFIETLAQAKNIGAKVLIDEDIFLDVEETGKKSIFLEDNMWIEGANDAKITVNNLLSPAFIMELADNITIRNISIVYNQTYDATFGYESRSNHLNQQQVEDYLTDNKGIVYQSTNPLWRGPLSYRAIILIDASENVRLENIKLISKGETADTFIQMAIKLKEQHTPNQIVTDEDGAASDIPRNVVMNNVTFDGTIMGIEGIVHGLEVNELKSFRYSDIQTASGDNIGGNVNGKYWMPPPHLFYLSKNSSLNYKCEDIKIKNTIDYGNYIGAVEVRETVSGYCNSLKMGDQKNVMVESYKSYRRDGFADLVDIDGGTFKNIYSESNSSIFDSEFKFQALRFLGKLENVEFQNLTIKDNSNVAEIYPLDVTLGDYVTMDNVHVYVNELRTAENGPFGVHGSNNKVINSSLNIKNHTSTKEYIGVVYLNDSARENSSDNHYEIQVEGWRNLDTRTVERSIRILLHEPSNPNTNYAKVTDLTNGMIVEQINETTTREPL